MRRAVDGVGCWLLFFVVFLRWTPPGRLVFDMEALLAATSVRLGTGCGPYGWNAEKKRSAWHGEWPVEDC